MFNIKVLNLLGWNKTLQKKASKLSFCLLSWNNTGLPYCAGSLWKLCIWGTLWSYWMVAGFGHPSSKMPKLQEANFTSAITSCSRREPVIVVQFGVKLGCNSLNSSADRRGPALLSMGTVPSPSLPGALLPCRVHPLLCTYFTWAFRWATCNH